MELSATAALWGAVGAQATLFLQRVAGPAADELGNWARDRVREFRSRNLFRALDQAAADLASEGVEPVQIPIRTLIPVLEGASREDDAELAERWSALIASAAHPRRAALVLPIFPHLLEQITPLDARILTLVERLDREPDPDEEPMRLQTPQGVVIEPRAWGVRRERIAAAAAIQAGELSIGLDTLSALGLIRSAPYPGEEPDLPFRVGASRVAVSALGARLLEACRTTAIRERLS